MRFQTRLIDRLYLTLILAVVAAIVVPTPAYAQENPNEPFTASAGPYQIEVIAVPSNLSLGRVQFAVIVLDAATEQPVTDANVVVRVQPASGATGNWGWGLAVRTTDVPGRYDAQMNMETPGVWNVIVEVSGSLGQVSVEAPPVTVPSSRGNFSQGSIVFLGVTLVLVLGVLYIWWSVRREQRRRASLPDLQQDEGRQG